MTGGHRPSQAMLKPVPAHAGASPGRPDTERAVLHCLTPPAQQLADVEITVSSFDSAGHPINFLSAVIDALELGEHAVVSENFLAGGSSVRGVILTEDVV